VLESISTAVGYGVNDGFTGDVIRRGMAPMHYLANWRMQVAAQKLRDRSESLAEIAQHGGLRIRGSIFTSVQEDISDGPGNVETVA
jgi:methylphosphotriester-DNA--protein-cysteine methyltransferase